MERQGMKTRDIQFYSNKNGAMVLVHSRPARDYAKYLEGDEAVASYEVCHPLDPQRFAHVNPVDIRPEYFQTTWTTDFLLYLADGGKAVRELVTSESLKKRATIEKLELSRRYWAALDVNTWQLTLTDWGR